MKRPANQNELKQQSPNQERKQMDIEWKRNWKRKQSEKPSENKNIYFSEPIRKFECKSIIQQINQPKN